MYGELYMQFEGVELGADKEAKGAHQRMQNGNDHVVIAGRLEGDKVWGDASFRTAYDGVVQANNRTQEIGDAKLDYSKRMMTCSTIAREAGHSAKVECGRLAI
jgi:hypothetical protein